MNSHRITEIFDLPRKGEPVSGMDKNEMKQLFKDALKEWLDQKFADFGKWSAAGIAAMVLAAMAYLALRMNGWSK